MGDVDTLTGDLSKPLLDWSKKGREAFLDVKIKIKIDVVDG